MNTAHRIIIEIQKWKKKKWNEELPRQTVKYGQTHNTNMDIVAHTKYDYSMKSTKRKQRNEHATTLSHNNSVLPSKKKKKEYKLTITHQ